jgi:hypothetical protein
MMFSRAAPIGRRPSYIVGWYPSAMMNFASRIYPRSPADEPIRLINSKMLDSIRRLIGIYQ